MRPGLYMVGNGGLFPANGRTQDDFQSMHFEYGDLVSVQIIRSRNPKLTALVNAVIGRIADGIGCSPEAIKTRLKTILGWTELVQMRDGSIKANPRRMSFDDLPDEDAFRDFWQAAEELLCARLLPELEQEEQEEVLAIMNGRRRSRRPRGNGRDHDKESRPR